MNPRKKIVLVNSNEEILESLKSNFQNHGFEAFTAKNAEETIHIALTENPEVIFSEINLDGVNGIKLCKKLKNDFNLKNIPFVFLTSNDDDYLMLGAMEAGANHFISFPASMPVLMNIIEELTLSIVLEDQ